MENHIWVGVWEGSCLVLRRPKSGLVFKNMVSACVYEANLVEKTHLGWGLGRVMFGLEASEVGIGL